jgi:prevent-host-death family protein
MKKLGAAVAKAQFLGLLTEVETKRRPILITRNGKPVAQLAPLDLPEETDPLDAFHFPGVKIVGDITQPIYSDEEWEQFFEESARQLK